MNMVIYYDTYIMYHLQYFATFCFTECRAQIEITAFRTEYKKFKGI